MLKSGLGLILTLIVVVGGFWLMGKGWYAIVKCFQKRVD